jgi:CheY-like chemotaxis protein
MPQPILLVEDNPDDVELTRRALRQHDVANEIVVARDGVEALDVLLGRPDLVPPLAPLWPALILLDLKLPRIDGLEVLRRLRAEPRTRTLPVIVLTTSTEDQDIVTSYTLGANSFVRKPVDFEAFTNAVRQLGVYWLLVNEPPPPGPVSS